MKSKSEGHDKQDKDLIRKTIELSELKSQLEDKNTELLTLNKELQKQNKDLIRKTIDMTELKAQLEDKNTELEAANREILGLLNSRTDFMNQAAHDLRTPLMPIITLTPIIKDRIEDENLKHDLSIVENNANYLNQIVNQLISIIKFQSGKFEGNYETINIKNLIEEVLANEENIFKMHRIKITKNIAAKLPRVKGNKLNLIEVVQNIISNSIKFMPRGGQFKISAFKKDNFIYVSMKDSGMGMAKKTLSKLFVPFFKADESRHVEGSGLGLSICKKIMEKHNGGITAESRGLGKGTEITFYLPALKES